MRPPIPPYETDRLAELDRYAILDSPPEPQFDRIVRIAKELFGVPIALISLIDADRQWFKSCFGLTTRETSRDISFCAHAIAEDTVLVVPDASQDQRFAHNPNVVDDPHIRFYAGAPLRTPRGFNLGTLCIIDTEPRPPLSSHEEALLADLAAIVVDELNLRLLHGSSVGDKTVSPSARSKAIDDVLGRLVHAINNPLSVILGFTDLLLSDDIDPAVAGDIAEIQTSARQLQELLRNSIETVKLLVETLPVRLTVVSVPEVVNAAVSDLSGDNGALAERVRIDIDEDSSVRADAHRLQRVVREVLSHSLRAAGAAQIRVSTRMAGDMCHIDIEVEELPTALGAVEAFLRFDPDSAGGVGLTLAKDIVGAMKGRVALVERPGRGAVTTISLLAAVPPPPGSRTLRVLYINDDAANLSLMSALLATRSDMELDIATDIEHGLRAARTDRPNVLLLDLDVSESRGHEILSFLAQDPETRDIAVVVLGSDDGSTNEHLADARVDAYLRKPLDLPAVLDAIDLAGLVRKQASHD